MEALGRFFSHLCGQGNCWEVGGAALPFCQRCTGLYVGAAIAMGLHLLLRPPSTYASRWVHGLLLLTMVPFGFHWIPQNGSVRMLTGQLFAVGVVRYLVLLPGEHVAWLGARRETGHRGYVVGTAAGLVAVQFLVRASAAPAYAALVGMGCLGAASLGALVLGNLLLLPAAFRSRGVAQAS